MKTLRSTEDTPRKSTKATKTTAPNTNTTDTSFPGDKPLRALLNWEGLSGHKVFKDKKHEEILERSKQELDHVKDGNAAGAYIKAASLMWKELTEEERQSFDEEAELLKKDVPTCVYYL